MVRVAFLRETCKICKAQRDRSGELTHAITCDYADAVDHDFIDDSNERLKIFVPYRPEIMK